MQKRDNSKLMFDFNKEEKSSNLPFPEEQQLYRPFTHSPPSKSHTTNIILTDSPSNTTKRFQNPSPSLKENHPSNIPTSMADQIMHFNNERNQRIERKRTDGNLVSLQNLDTGLKTPPRGDRKKMRINSGFNFANRQRNEHSFPSSFDYGSGVHSQNLPYQFYQTHQPQFSAPLENSYYGNWRADEYGSWNLQMQDASKMIQKQNEIIYSLRNELRKLQDVISQKDSTLNLRNLECLKYRETIEMLQFDLDRMRLEFSSSGKETPRIQNENKIIRDQVKSLLEEAKERFQEITRHKKIIGMYECQVEDLEHKLVIMKNREIKLEAELEQVNESLR
jgi:hypothetical protein